MTLITPVKSFLISRGLLKCMAEIYSAPEITRTYYFKVKNIPIFNVDYKIPDFSKSPNYGANGSTATV